MLRIRRILVPTDFSECGDSAIPCAVRIAQLHNAEVHLLHAVPEWRFDSLFQLHDATDSEAMQKVLRYRADYRLRARAAELPVPAEWHVVEGKRHASSAIVSHAADHGVHLVVMARHGRRGVGRLLAGSVTEEVLHRSTCPVLTVHAGRAETPADGAFHDILVPVDFSWRSHLALGYAKEMAAAHGASVHVLHVVNEATCPDFYLSGSRLTGEGRSDLASEAGRRLVEFSDGTGNGDSAVRASVRFGRPASEIVDCATDSGCDLILMASHGLGGLLRFMLGSVTTHVVHAAPCSVLVTNWGRGLVPGNRTLSSHYSEITPSPEAVGTVPAAPGTKTTV
jgi:nucleotide-binding universal stress UspA family protein